MYTGQIDFISNKADWNGPFIQLIDDDTGLVIDILNIAVGFDCWVYVKTIEGVQQVLGSVANGKVVASTGPDGPGFQWHFTKNDLSGLCAGPHRFGIKTLTNGETNDLFVGTVGIIEGN